MTKNTADTTLKSASAKKNTQKTTQDKSSSSANLDLDKLMIDDTQLEITIAWKKVEPVYQRHLANQAKIIKLKGFRQGKVPLNLAEKEIGTDKIINLALQDLLPQAFQDAVAANHHQPISMPEFQGISLNKDNDWIVKAFYSLKPNLSIKDFQKITKKTRVELEKQLKKSAENDSAIDKKKNKAVTSTKAEADDQSDRQHQDTLAQGIIAKLIEEYQPKVPKLLIKQAAQREYENFVGRLADLKLDLETFLKSRQMTQDQLFWEMVVSSFRQYQVEFLLEAIANELHLAVSDTEVETFINQTKDDALKEKMLKNENYKRQLQANLQKQKTLEALLAIK